MIRDKVKQSTYFDDWIAFDESAIKDVKARLSSGTLSHYGRVLAASNIRSKLRDRIVMRYSRGDGLALLRFDMEDFLAAQNQLRSYCDALPPEEQNLHVQFERISYDNYLFHLWWLAWVVCLNMGSDHANQALALIGNAGQDSLMDRIARKIIGDQRTCAGELVFPKQFDLLSQAIVAPAEAKSALVKKFLDGWYKRNKKLAAWYDTHVDDDSGYVGYWCFEAALVVRLFDIDDLSFCDHDHYPRDLVRFK